MTRNKKTGHYTNNVTSIKRGTPEDDAVSKLKDLQREAIAVRSAMDFCVRYVSIERLVAENLPLEATLALAKRNKISMMDAREVVAKMLAERHAPMVESAATDIAIPDNGDKHE